MGLSWSDISLHVRDQSLQSVTKVNSQLPE